MILWNRNENTHRNRCSRGFRIHLPILQKLLLFLLAGPSFFQDKLFGEAREATDPLK
jgi:hypothetical protein